MDRHLGLKHCQEVDPTMPTHIPTVLTGTFLSASLALHVGCDVDDSTVANGDDITIESNTARDSEQQFGPLGPLDQLEPLDQLQQLEPLEPLEQQGPLDKQEPLLQLQQLGKFVFFDPISNPTGMSCATCHDPASGWTPKDSNNNLHQVAMTGADPNTAGTLKVPTNAYATKIVRFQPGGLNFIGGNFWDGRAEGNEDPAFFPETATQNVGDEVFEKTQGLKSLFTVHLGPVADQALNPFPNPVEQNIEPKKVCQHVAKAKYAPLYEGAWGEAINCSNAPYGTKGFKAFEVSFRRIAVAIAAWQGSKEVNSFSSKRDIALAAQKIEPGKLKKEFPLDGLTAQENLGHDLFYGKANCAACHSDRPRPFNPSDPSPFDDGTEVDQLYSDDSYHNIGGPANPEIAGFPTLQIGLAAHAGAGEGPLGDTHTGHWKTPTLRNVDKRPGKSFVKAYTHNGWFKSLESLVHFYNTSAIGSETANNFGVTQCPEPFMTEKEALALNCWPVPEQNADAVPKPFLIGDLGLSLAEEAALVAYLKTFTDTQTVQPPKPYAPKQMKPCKPSKK